MRGRIISIIPNGWKPRRNEGSRDPDGQVCSAGQCSICIDPFGNIKPCNAIDIPLGNVLRDDLKTVWEQSPVLHTLRALRFRDVCGKCERCEAFSNCGLCLGYIHWHPEREAVVDPEICSIAQANLDVNRKF